MFYYLDGTVAEILPYLAVIDCGGVGYACKTTNTTLAQLKKGQRGKLYTYLDVGENAFGLYGFATANELNSFKLLIGVSGVGPKAALAILSAATPESLNEAQKYGTLELAKIENMRTQADDLAAGKHVQSTDDLDAVEAELESVPAEETPAVAAPEKPYGFLAVCAGDAGH